MNPVFIILVILAAILLWFLLSFLFTPLGKFISRIWNGTANDAKTDEHSETEEKSK